MKIRGWLYAIAMVVTTVSCASDEAGLVVAASDPEPLFLTSSVWHQSQCLANEDCQLADVNGDGLEDAVAINRSTDEVWVALSNNSQFLTRTRWISGNACRTGDRCMLGDVNHDGRADLVAIDSNTVWVALSTSTSFITRTIWGPGSICTIVEDCKLADVNRDGFADIVAFVKDSQTGAGRGDVYVSKITVINGVGSFPFVRSAFPWHDFFCLGAEVCDVADVNGDGAKDLVTFLRSTPGSGAPAEGDVYVALSDPDHATFGAASIWHSWFCVGNENCRTADVDNDGKADLVSITGSGPVWIALSNGTNGFGAGEFWHSSFCKLGEVCRVGNVGGRGGGADLVAFTRDARPAPEQGDVTVSLAEKFMCSQFPEGSACDYGTWTGGEIPYVFDSAVTAPDQMGIRTAMDKWQEASANIIKFVANSTKTPRLTIKPCTVNGGESPGFGTCSANPNACTAFMCASNAGHELGHAIGFAHQHQRQDRDHYLRINRYPGCDAGSSTRCNLVNTTDFGPFDYKSTMLYPPADPDLERWDQTPICETRDAILGIGCANGALGPGAYPTAGDGAAAVELYSRLVYPKFRRTFDVRDPSPYTRPQAPYNEVLASGVTIAPTASPAIETWGDTSLAMYLRGTDGNIYKRFYNTSASQWNTTWEALGRPSGVSATATSDPAVVSWAGGRTDVVMRGGTSIYIMSTPTWGTWQSLGTPPNGGAVSAPAITSFGPNHLDVFVRAGNNQIFHKWCTANCSGASGTWNSTWDVLGTGTFRGKPAVTTRGNGLIELFGHGMDDKLWQIRFNGNWGSWNQVPANGTLAFDSSNPDGFSPAAGSRSASNIDVYIRGTDNKVWFTSWNGSTWSGYSALGGVLTSSPSTVSRVRDTPRSDLIVVMAEERSAGGAKHFGTWWKQIGN